MNRRILAVALIALALAALSACGGNGVAPGASGSGSSSGPLLVQITQPPPASMTAGSSLGLVATVFNDKNNAGVTWSCTPANACGSFNPTTTGYQIDTLYSAPIAPPNGPITTNLAYTVTITATSNADNSQSASATVTVAQQYAFVLEGFGGLGMAGSITLDGNGNVTSGEADWSGACCGPSSMTLNGTYNVDATGHGSMTLNLINTIFGTFPQTHSITATSNSHLVIAEDDEFAGLTIGGIGSMDLQTAGPNFSASQVSGGYSFTSTGFSNAAGLNGNWGGIFTADGVGTISGGFLDANFVGTNGGQGYVSTPFTGTFTAPDGNGRGTMILSTGDTYAYYIVTPEVLRISKTTNAGSYVANTGSAFGQGSVASTNAALTGSYVFGDIGFDVPGNATGAAGQFTTDGGGNITAGVMDLNDSGAGVVIAGLSLAGSTYSISGSPRGTIIGPSGQTYNVYLTDPNLNLLDPNSTSGTGGALLLETDATFGAIGVVLPQADPASATIQGTYATVLSDQNNPPNLDGGFTGVFTAPSSGAGTFSGEGEFDTNSLNGPLSGTFAADGANPGRFTGTITTTPGFPNGTPGDTTPGTENVSYYLANSSQGFVVETDSVAPVTGVLELQVPASPASVADKRQRTTQQSSHRAIQTTGRAARSLPRHAGSTHE